MTRQDWLTAFVVAVFVAVLTVAVTAPPMCWAGPKTPVTVPALPSATLDIPSMHARITASAIPAPGQAVEVTLAVTPAAPVGTPAGGAHAPVAVSPAKSSSVSLPAPFGAISLRSLFGESGIVRVLFARVTPVMYRVPVTVTVLRTDMDMFARSMPLPEQVTQLETTVPIGPGGKGSVVVPLPLTWAEPEKTQAKTTGSQPVQPIVIPRRSISYQMVLSSPLGGKAAPSELRRVAQISRQQGADRRL